MSSNPLVIQYCPEKRAVTIEFAKYRPSLNVIMRELNGLMDPTSSTSNMAEYLCQCIINAGRALKNGTSIDIYSQGTKYWIVEIIREALEVCHEY